jgi:hypothetical protein
MAQGVTRLIAFVHFSSRHLAKREIKFAAGTMAYRESIQQAVDKANLGAGARVESPQNDKRRPGIADRERRLCNNDQSEIGRCLVYGSSTIWLLAGSRPISDYRNERPFFSHD